jgi:glycosyltransferase involved in cell wall biosynthesis
MAANLTTNALTATKIRESYPNKTLIGQVGALVERHKGQQYTIEAARHLETTHPHLHFLLIGDGQDEALLKQKAQGLTNIEFIGFKSNIGDYLRALDIFLFPSLQEGLGSTLLDAMEAGLPIVAAEVGGIPDIIKHKINGLLIPPQDALAIANAILVLVKNVAFAKNLGEQGNTEVINYSPAVISQRYMDVYKTICNGEP